MAAFIDEVMSAEWLANVGLPLLVAAGSLFLAVWLVGRQLRHDRELTRAERRADAAGELGWTLREIGDRIDQMGLDDPRWLQEWEGWRESHHALRRASIMLGRLEPLYAIARELDWRWRGALAAREHYSVEANLHAWVLGDFVHVQVTELRSAGAALLNWDGLDDPPLPEDASRMPLPVKAKAHLEWGRGVVEEYKALVDDARAKGYPRALPPIDVSSWFQ